MTKEFPHVRKFDPDPDIDNGPAMPARMHARNLFGALRMHLVSLRDLTAEEASRAR